MTVDRWPFAIKKFDGVAVGPHLLITGGVHGDEFEPMVAIRQLIREMSNEALRGRLTLVPIVHEEAFRYGRRTASDGLDLARICPGRQDGCLTERTAFALSQLIRSADYYIDLHTGGARLSVLPMSGFMLHADPTILEQQRKMARSFNLPIIWGTDPNLDGRSLSVARDAGVPAIYAEFLGGGRFEPAGVAAYVQGCLNVMGALGMIQRESPAVAVDTVVEDGRKNSGYMQICNRAPNCGFFAPSVRLGAPVSSGDPLGTIADALGTSITTVRANQDGMVLVLSTSRRVAEGESLAVILETDR